MKRLIVALLVGGAVFGTVWGLASTLQVTFLTAATGEGDVGSCGDMTGGTFILQGQDVNPKTGPSGGFAALSGSPTNIARTTQVNLEFDGNCDEGIQVDIHLTDINGADIPGAFGTCQVWAAGGLGFDEVGIGDNTDGCTVDLNVSQDIGPIEDIKVTQH